MGSRILTFGCGISQKEFNEYPNSYKNLEKFEFFYLRDFNFNNVSKFAFLDWYRDFFSKHKNLSIKGHSLFNRRGTWTPLIRFEKGRKRGTYSQIDGIEFVKELIDFKIKNLDTDSWILFNEIYSPKGLIPIGLYYIWGPNYVEEILDYCKNKYPVKKFYINEYGIQNLDIYKTLLKSVNHLPFDGLGIQVYSGLEGCLSSKIENNLEYIKNHSNFPLFISEFNIFSRINLPLIIFSYYERLIKVFKKLDIREAGFWWTSTVNYQPHWLQYKPYGYILDEGFNINPKIVKALDR